MGVRRRSAGKRVPAPAKPNLAAPAKPNLAALAKPNLAAPAKPSLAASRPELAASPELVARAEAAAEKEKAAAEKEKAAAEQARAAAEQAREAEKDAEQAARDGQMGVVRRKRGFRNKMERRQVPAGKGAASDADAASAWGSHLEARIKEEEKGVVTVRRTPKAPLPDDLVGDAIQPNMHHMAHKLANDQSEHEASSGFSGASVLPSFPRVRPFVAAALVLTGLVAGALPVWGEVAFRRKINALDQVMEAEAVRVAAENPEMGTWLRAQRLAELRDVYDRETPKLMAALNAARAEVQRQHVSVRVDFEGGGLILSAVLDDDDRDLSASSHTAGVDAGRPPPKAGFGPSVVAHLYHLLAFLLGGGALAGALWFVPALRDR